MFASVSKIDAKKTFSSNRHSARVVNGLDLNPLFMSSNGFGLASSNLVCVATTIFFFGNFCSHFGLPVRLQQPWKLARAVLIFFRRIGSSHNPGIVAKPG